MDVVFNWNLGNMIYNGHNTLRLYGFPFVEIRSFQSASPFIDKRDGFTGERERVRMFLSLVAHVDEGSDDGWAHNTVDVTVECQVHMGGCVGFFRKSGCRYLQNTIIM